MKKIIDFTVKENLRLNDDMFLLSLYSRELPKLKPGQFVNVKVDNSPTTFLRRPISVHDVDETKKILYLLIKIAGDGTQKLSELRPEERLNIILPLGNSFSLPDSGKCLLVGGGVGIAPMLHLSKELKQKGISPVILIGARTKKDLIRIEEFGKYAKVYHTTEDGSYGEKGYPTQHSILNEKFDYIFTCGPEPMMKSVAQHAYSNNIECEVSLENTMACGIGACLCCVADTKHGHKCICTEGPVCNIKELKWQI